MYKITTLILVLSSFIFFQNCGEDASFNGKLNPESSGAGDSLAGQGSSEQGPGEGADINDQLTGDEGLDIEIINKTCQNSTPLRKVISLNFPKPQSTCNWNQAGNLDKRNGYFQARIEQKRNLDLPAGAVICNAQFDFSQQEFLYDDHFLLTFNQSVIASSYDFRQQLQPKNLGLLEYNWSKMAGMNWENSKETIFCPQVPGAEARCNFPGHDQQGTILLDYDPIYIRAIMSEGIPSNHSFTMVSIGDNDELDCEHSDVTFDIMVDYVIPQSL